MPTLTHGQVFQILEKWAPTSFAYEWDNVGLQVGSSRHETNKIMVTLDVTEAVVHEAIANSVNLIIAHHPLIFSKLKNINVDSFKGKVIQQLIQQNITVYAAHTNLDIAKGGVNDILSEALGLQRTKNLINIPRLDQGEGLGKVGYVEETTLESLCNKVKKAFDMPAVRVIGDLQKPIKKVAILGGSGEKFIYDAIKGNADVLITGDITYHHGQDAQEMGLAIIDAGHYIEHIFISPTRKYLTQELATSRVEIIESIINTDPFQFA